MLRTKNFWVIGGDPRQAALAELGRLLKSPVGKSGVNHRLRRLSEIADQLREQ